jgi:hypothetical protein
MLPFIFAPTEDTELILPEEAVDPIGLFLQFYAGSKHYLILFQIAENFSSLLLKG